MLALDIMTGSVAWSVFGDEALHSNSTPAEVMAAANSLGQNNDYLLTSLFLGTFSTVLGGYIAARLAKNLPLFNACAVGVVGIAIGILLCEQSDSPGWFNALGYLSTIPAAIVGGWLARNEKRPGP